MIHRGWAVKRSTMHQEKHSCFCSVDLHLRFILFLSFALHQMDVTPLFAQYVLVGQSFQYTTAGRTHTNTQIQWAENRKHLSSLSISSLRAVFLSQGCFHILLSVALCVCWSPEQDCVSARLHAVGLQIKIIPSLNGPPEEDALNKRQPCILASFIMSAIIVRFLEKPYNRYLQHVCLSPYQLHKMM